MTTVKWVIMIYALGKSVRISVEAPTVLTENLDGFMPMQLAKIGDLLNPQMLIEWR